MWNVFDFNMNWAVMIRELSDINQLSIYTITQMKPEQNGQHFADNISW